MSMSINPWAAGVLFFVGTFIFPLTFMLQRFWWRETASGRAFARNYRLTEKDTVDISNKIVSSFQAVCAGASGFLIYQECLHDVLHSTSSWSIIYAWFGIPYFVYDTFCMFYVYTYSHPSKDSMVVQFLRFVLKSPVIFIHHMIMAPVGWTLIVFFRNKVEPGDFFVGIIYMMECSTPFVSLRFVLSKLSMKSSPWYVLNGVLMLLTFPVFRIGSVFYAGVLYSEQNHFPNLFQGLWSIPFYWKAIWISAVAPQIYWFILMWRGLMKIFFQISNKSSSSGGAHSIPESVKDSVLKQDFSVSADNNSPHHDGQAADMGSLKSD